MLEDYLQELQKIALLQPEEEAALWQAYKEGGDANARSRLNAIFFTGMFVGMSSGAALGGLAMAQWGWNGVVAMATATSLSALLVRMYRH